MKRLLLLSCGLAIAAGCSSQTASKLGDTAPVQMPDRLAARTVLEDVKLHDKTVREISQRVRAQVEDDMRFRAQEAGDPDAGVAMRLTTVGALEKEHLFPNSYLADDTQVVLATSQGQFHAWGAENGAVARPAYGQLVGMFDPITGETLGTGLRP